ncbi:WXG100 family type VII secretion target, partial [Microbacterium sp. HD4P20]
MADFGASYSEMEQVASSLSQARDDIQGQLDSLKSQVDTLLGEDFKTQHASGKFGEGYSELTTGLKGAVDGINDMS